MKCGEYMLKKNIVPSDDVFLDNFLKSLQTSNEIDDTTYRKEMMQEYIKSFYDDFSIPKSHILKIIEFVAGTEEERNMKYSYYKDKEFKYNDEAVIFKGENKSIYYFENKNGEKINLPEKEAYKIFNDYKQEQRKEKLDSTQKILENGCKEIFTSGKYKNYLNVMSQFRRYSVRNNILILMQKSDATMVASATDWKEKFGRYVNKGEKGLQILRPNYVERKIYEEKKDEATGEVIKDDNNNTIKVDTGKTERVLQGFSTASVFDVSQTNGKELPQLVTKLNMEVSNFNKIISGIASISPCPIFFEPLTNYSEGVNGYYSNNEIHIRDTMSEAQTIKTAIHELAHATYHSNINNNSKDRNTKEVEAESIAYIVSNTLGIDTSDYSFGYIASWAKNKDIPELISSSDTIKKASNEIIEKLENVMPDLFEQIEKNTEIKLSFTDYINTLPKDDNKLIINQDIFDYIKKNYNDILSGIILSNCHFDTVDFSANEKYKFNSLENCSFVGCVFNDSVNLISLKGSAFLNCNFNNMSIESGDFTSAEFINAEFKNCNIQSSFVDARFYGCIFENTKLENADFNRTMLSDCKFDKNCSFNHLKNIDTVIFDPENDQNKLLSIRLSGKIIKEGQQLNSFKSIVERAHQKLNTAQQNMSKEIVKSEMSM